MVRKLSLQNSHRNQEFYKFTSSLTFNHWLDCSFAKLQNVNNINSRPNKVTQYQRMVTSIFLPNFDGNLITFEVTELYIPVASNFWHSPFIHGQDVEN